MPSRSDDGVPRCLLCSMDCPIGAQDDGLGHVSTVFPAELGFGLLKHLQNRLHGSGVMAHVPLPDQLTLRGQRHQLHADRAHVQTQMDRGRNVAAPGRNTVTHTYVSPASDTREARPSGRSLVE